MGEHLFVYGTLLPGHAPAAMRDVVATMRVVGPATVRGRLYDLGSYPGLVLDVSDDRVHGQVLAVPDDPDAWLRLDAYEGFVIDEPERSLFRRARCPAAVADGAVIECWVYVYNDGGLPPGRPVEGGVWRAAARLGTSPVRTELTARTNGHRRPVIGITMDRRDDVPVRYESNSDYAASIERAGGLPMYVPYRTDLSLIPQLVDLLDGVLFTGGDDLDPALYGESWHPRAHPVDPARQRFELALLAEVERRRMPALGICLGAQLMNVHRGGSLHQFLPEGPQRDAPLDHRKDPEHWNRRHPVWLEPGTPLAEAVGKTEMSVNTRHKQAVRRLGRGLRVIATAPDGVIEGVEDPSMPLFMAVQWHPENLSAEPEHLALFKLLVNRSKGADTTNCGDA